METRQNSLPPTNAGTADRLLRTAGARLEAISTLVNDLDAAPIAAPASAALQFENQLVQVRLGIASSLFNALRVKHQPTASHSLRVAMGCSAWGVLLGLPESDRDELEMGALLHDIGKIGVPDAVLLKPGALSAEEFHVAEQHRVLGVEVLRGCCASPGVLAIVRYSGAWYNGSRGTPDLSGDHLPLGARMVALVDAFDSMTSDQPYRRALARERALAELFDFAGTQFDPNLLREFCNYLNADQSKLMEAVCRRWLKDLQPSAATSWWQMGASNTAEPTATVETLFQEKLLEHMHDAVVFVDAMRRILLWNRAAERLTGVNGSGVEHKIWHPELVGLRDDQDAVITDEQCPVLHGISHGTQTFRRMHLTVRGRPKVAVDAHVIPVVGQQGVVHGATLILRDASSQISLEERVQTLHEKASRDPLTKAANRAEFNRTHDQMVSSHLEQGLPCALIICDIDHFKKINDTYGHQAGDEVLISFSALLQRHCRTGDLVARYGGEEFVLLCSDCDNNAATQRAEKIRKELAVMPQAALSGNCITSSFGVTELQAGDTPETMLNRADRALYQAKENGRNAVVQLGSGIFGERSATPGEKATWWSWLVGGKPTYVLNKVLAASVPLNLAAEKLKGFVSDQQAEIVSIDPKHVSLRIDGEKLPQRRAGDRAMSFLVELRFEEQQHPIEGRNDYSRRTLIHVAIQPSRARDRRHADLKHRATQLLASLRSYLVAVEVNDAPEEE